ncbi:MAG TPA: LacI family DNA-binding transcriptional regulator [Burkholderiaceae bacterium]
MPAKKNPLDKSESGMTMEDLAAIAGVSAITVSRALRNSPLVTEKTRAKIREVAEQHGYRLNISARNLRLRRSYSVAVVVEMTPAKNRPMSDPYPLDLLGGITQELTTAGYSVLLTSKQLIDTAPVQSADGMILLGQGPHGEAVQTLQRTGLPLVVWGAPDALHPCTLVGSDNRAGGASVAQHFLARQCRHMVFLGDVDHAEIHERYLGFTEALGELGKSVLLLTPQAFTFEAGYDSIAALIKRGDFTVDGIFAASDLLAMGAIRALDGSNIKVPQQVSVVGYDDTPAAATFVPPLTTVHQYLRDGGVLLARKILGLIEGEPVESESLGTTLVVRQT